ncbi:MAG: hypothetical protein R6V20_09435 [Desulfobia sp.]
MALLVVYTGYSYLYESPADKDGDNGRSTGELNKFVKETSLLLREGELSEVQAYSIRRAEAGWQRNPFYAPPLKEEKESKGKKDNAVDKKFIYSGFLEGGGKRIAIINGLEYEVGETLGGDKFVLQGILPGHVVIGVREKKQTMSVPIME